MVPSFKEELICIVSKRWWRDFDYWVKREKISTGALTVHFVKPRMLAHAVALLHPVNKTIIPEPSLPQDHKKADHWKPLKAKRL